MTAYVRPDTLDQALEARAEHPDFMLLAGGTDLLVGADKQPEPAGIIDVFGLAPLSSISAASDGGVSIGAAVPYAAMLDSVVVRQSLPCLVAAAREIGALQIQARGTLGGNIGTSSPVGDSLPCLLALDAEVELASVRGVRAVPYRDYCTGYRKTAIEDDEIITQVHFPARPSGEVQLWRKVGTRRAQSISKVMMAATATVAPGANRVIGQVRIGLGAVADRPIRAREVEDTLAGARPGAELAQRAADVLARTITPIDDIRSRARYRLRVAQNLVARFVAQLETC